MKEKGWAALPNGKVPSFTIFESEKCENVSTHSTSLTMVNGEYTSLLQRIAGARGCAAQGGTHVQ